MGRIGWTLSAIFIAAAVAGGMVFLSYSNDIDQARSAVANGARIANTAAGPIEYAERGDGIPLLSIHGAGGGWDQGLTNVADLVGSGFRVIAPSRFGYLGTPIPADASPSAQAIPMWRCSPSLRSTRPSSSVFRLRTLGDRTGASPSG